MNKISKAGKAARVILAGGALLALSLGGVGAATAADGHLNQGVTEARITPTAPAVNFDTPGTTGNLVYNAWDGSAPGSANIKAGDVERYTYGLPEGLEFPANVCDRYAGGGTNAVTVTCTLNPDRRGLIVSQVAKVDFKADADFVRAYRSLPVVSTGEPITGTPGISFTPWTGLTTEAAHANVAVVQTPSDGTPLLAGGVLAAGALGAGALVLRRRRAAA